MPRKPVLTAKKTALLTLAAMEYSDIIHLSYRQALGLWLPLNRGKCRADLLRHYTTTPPNINFLRLRIEDLQDYWAKYHKIGGGLRDSTHEHPSVFFDQAWNQARIEEHVNNDGSIDIENRCKSPSFSYSDSDLQWIGSVATLTLANEQVISLPYQPNRWRSLFENEN